jgi:hypothetical protein
MAKDLLHRIIKEKASKLILYTPHAIQQMNKEERLIRTEEIQKVISQGKIIEDYPEDKRGHSCIISGKVSKRHIHVVCSPKDEYLAIITAYIPDSKRWEKNFTKRKLK